MTLAERLLELKGDKTYQWLEDELGIAKSHIFPCLTQGRPMGTKFLSAVLAKWPELESLVLTYIKERNNDGADDLKTDATERRRYGQEKPVSTEKSSRST